MTQRIESPLQLLPLMKLDAMESSKTEKDAASTCRTVL